MKSGRFYNPPEKHLRSKNMEEVSKKERSKDRLPFGITPLWSTRALSVAVYVVLLMQLTYYATEVLGLGAAVVGTVLLLSKLFDGFTDLIVGYIIDKTNTKLGKGRPYELFIIPLWVCTALMFSTPDIGTTGKIVWIFVMYSLAAGVCATFLQASETVFLGRAVGSDMQRGKLMAFSGVIVMLFASVGSMILPQLMNTWGKESGGWTRIALTYAVPMGVLGLLRFFFVKEQNVTTNIDKNEKKQGMKESILILIKNKYVFILAAIILLSNLAQNIGSIMGTYYFTYIMGNLGLLSIVGMFGLLTPFLMLLFPLSIRTIGATAFVRIGFILAALGNVLKFLGQTNLPMILIGTLLAGFGTSTVTMMNHYFMLQCIDYGEFITGKRVEGMPSSIMSFTSKIGSGLASVSVGFLMGIAGYVGSTQQQTPSALGSIVALYTLIPAGICVAMLVILHFFYDVEKKLPALRKAHEERLAGNN
jgi:GPH family glycoside/pentoside/hexuronide:cation symporter